MRPAKQGSSAPRRIPQEEAAAALHRQQGLVALALQRLDRQLRDGYVQEACAPSEMPAWWRLGVIVRRFLGLSLPPARRRRPMTPFDREVLGDRRRVLRGELELIGADLGDVEAWRRTRVARGSDSQVASDGTYPDDWAAISLSYRREVGFICENCGRHVPDGHVHHIIAVRRGGTSDRGNLLFLCPDCHALEHPHMRSS